MMNDRQAQSPGDQRHGLTPPARGTPRRSRATAFGLGAVVLLAVIWGYTIQVVSGDHELATERALTRASHTAQLFEQQTLRTFRYADSYVRAARHAYGEDRSVENLDRFVRDVPVDTSIMSHITLIGADGTPRYISGRPVKPGTTAKDRAYFKAQQARRDDGVVLSLPRKGRNSGRVTLRLVRRIGNRDGSFDGVLMGSIGVAQVTAFFEGVKPGPRAVAQLVGLDKTLRAHSDAALVTPIQNVARSVLWRVLEEAPAGTYREVDVLDGIERIFSYQRVADFPIVAVVGVAMGDIRAEARQAAIQAIIAAALASVIVIGVAIAGYRSVAAGEARYRVIFEAAADGIVNFTTDGRIAGANQAACRMFGRPPADMTGTRLLDLVRDCCVDENGVADGTSDSDWLASVADADAPVEATGVSASGAVFPIRLSVSTARVRNQTLYVAIFRNITRQKRSERLLAESEQRFRDFGEVASDWFWEMDDRMRFSYFSDLFTPITGVPQQALIGKTREETGIPGVDSDTWRRHLDDLQQHRPFSNFTHPRTLPDGRMVWLSISGKPVFGPDGRFVGYRGTGSDVTDEMEAARELRLAKENAETANRAKSEFVSSMSHELRTPLNAILGFAQLMESDRQEPPSERHRSWIGQIRTGGELLLSLINQVLEFETVEEGRTDLDIAPTEPIAALEECLLLARSLAAARDITVSEAIEPPSGDTIDTDATRLKQVVINLLSNAVKYNRRNGTVHLQAAMTDAGWYRISVIDDGPGIGAEYHAQVFEPFERLGQQNRGIEGTGIGLSISKKVMERLGGHIGFTSEAGNGSHFWIELPAPGSSSQEPTKPEVEPASWVADGMDTLPSLDGTPGLVLYVEDNDMNVQLMQMIFEALPTLTLSIATDAESGLEIARRDRPALILMDIHLPGMNGIEALHHLKADPATSHIPVVAISAAAMKSDVDHALEAGFEAYLTKPVNVRELIALITRELERSA